MSFNQVISEIAAQGGGLDANQVRTVVKRACPLEDYRGKRVLLIVPDGTRTAPIGMMFAALHAHLSESVKTLDVMIALGTHPPMSEEAICQRLEITAAERAGRYGNVRFLNHAWDNPAELKEIGTISSADVKKLTNGLFAMDVPVEINRHVFEYDQLMIVGPVFPHEVVGFSGGNKYLFPGVSGPRVLNFFHWLGAVITNATIIGTAHTPVRAVVDRAASMVGVEKFCFCLVVDKGGMAGLFAGKPEAAWREASQLSAKLHIIYKERPFHTVLSCAPAMYDDLWVGGKCMYKLEPVLAPGAELIIYAPHIHEVSTTHGRTILELGYHCRDYFLKQWDRFKDYPWGVVAHSTHVRGGGTYENGIEKCTVSVTLATGISPEICQRINLGYRDPKTIRQADYANREAEGVLLVPKAGEMLYRLSS